MKLSTDAFASQIGLTRQSVYFREHDQKDWCLDELIKITELMKTNNIAENLTVSKDGNLYDICITKVSE